MAFVDALSVDTGTASALTTPNLVVPGTVQVDDIGFFLASTERVLVPAINIPSGSSGLQDVDAAAGGSNMAYRLSWKRITSADLGGTFTASTTSTRRQVLAAAFYRGYDDPVFTSGAYTESGTGDYAAEHPNVTPAAANSLLLSLTAAFNLVTPYQRTFASASGWTQRIGNGSKSTTASNGFGIIAEKQLTGNAGVVQTGNVVTDQTPEKFAYKPFSVVLTPRNLAAVPAGWKEVRLFSRA